MVEKKYPPTLWTNDEIYTSYLEFLDHKTPPLEQVKYSIQSLLSYADKHEIDISEVFNQLRPTEVIHMVRTRQLSPWLLIFCTSFKVMVRDRVSPEQSVILETLIRPEYWISKIDEQPPETIEKIKEIAKELNL